MNCPKCGSALRPGARFCGNCGADVSALWQTAAAPAQAPNPTNPQTNPYQAVGASAPAVAQPAPAPAPAAAPYGAAAAPAVGGAPYNGVPGAPSAAPFAAPAMPTQGSAPWNPPAAGVAAAAPLKVPSVVASLASFWKSGIVYVLLPLVVAFLGGLLLCAWKPADLWMSGVISAAFSAASVNLDPRMILAAMAVCFNAPIILTVSMGSADTSDLLGSSYGASLGSGSTVAYYPGASGSLSSGLSGASSSYTVSYMDFTPFLLVGCIATLLMIVCAVTVFGRNKHIYKTWGNVLDAAVAGLVCAGLYTILAAILPYTYDAPPTTCSGASLPGFLLIWIWVGVSVFIAEQLRCARARHGGLKAGFKGMFDSNMICRAIWQNGVLVLIGCVFATLYLIVDSLIVSGGSGMLDVLKEIVFLPETLLYAGIMTAAPISTTMASVGGYTDSMTFDETWANIGAGALITFIIMGLLLLCVASLMRYKVHKNKAYDPKQLGAFVGVALVMWLLIIFFSMTMESVDAGKLGDAVGAYLGSGSGSVNGIQDYYGLTWLVVLTETIFALLADVIGGLALPHMVAAGGQFLDKLAETKPFQFLSGTFVHGGAPQLVRSPNATRTANPYAYQVAQPYPQAYGQPYPASGGAPAAAGVPVGQPMPVAQPAPVAPMQPVQPAPYGQAYPGQPAAPAPVAAPVAPVAPAYGQPYPPAAPAQPNAQAYPPYGQPPLS